MLTSELAMTRSLAALREGAAAATAAMFCVMSPAAFAQESEASGTEAESRRSDYSSVIVVTARKREVRRERNPVRSGR